MQDNHYNTVDLLSSNNNSSKAVLAALYSLQDKIKRLENERNMALNETIHLKTQIQQQEIETKHIKNRDNITIQKNLQDIRNTYDRNLLEKTEQEIRLANIEERNRIEKNISEELYIKIRELEDEKNKNLNYLKDLENDRNQLKNQIVHIQHNEKGE